VGAAEADQGSLRRPGYRRSAGTPRGEARRRELLDRVVDDLAVNGLVDFSLRRAARAAGTTHKVLLYHFDGAEDLLDQAIFQLRERRIANSLASINAAQPQTLSARVRAIWPALLGEESRVLDQAMGLMMYDPLRYAGLGQGASQQYLPTLLSILPPDWSEQRKVEVGEMILAALRGLLIDRLTSGNIEGVDAGFEALARALDREEAAADLWAGQICEPRGSLLGMQEHGVREKVRFDSGGTECVAWHYPGTNGSCVIMAGGFAVTKEPGTDLFAKRFHEAGFSVLAFDYRHLGESGGQPRQVVRVREQLADWDAAISLAAGLPGVDPARLAIWAFSASGGYVFGLAARDPRLAAAIAQTPNADNIAASRNAARYQKPLAMLRFTGRGVLDAIGSLAGRTPRLVPLTGEPGTVALLTTPDSADAGAALNPGGRYPEWQQAVAARSALRLGFWRPGRLAARVRCPLLVLVCDQDQSALAGPAVRAARRAPGAELVRLSGGHYAPFLEGHEQAVTAELSFLRRHLLDAPGPAAAAGSDAAGSDAAHLDSAHLDSVRAGGRA
jgi:fermentation-respiration switch protein FrsA (DUF1100 family)/AcrR family transcriptional regulator